MMSNKGNLLILSLIAGGALMTEPLNTHASIAGKIAHCLNTSEIYDPNAHSWVQGPTLKAKRCNPATVKLLSGKVMLIGGDFEPSSLLDPANSVEIFDPVHSTFTMVSPTHEFRDRSSGVALLSDGRVLVSGGFTGGPMFPATNTAEIYDPAKNEWSVVSSMNVGREGLKLIPLKNNRVLAVGGNPHFKTGEPEDGIRLSKITEIYDANTDTWKKSANTLSSHIVGFEAQLLSDGRVWVAGGGGVGYPGFYGESAAEIYDPNTEVWTLAPSLYQGRVFFTSFKGNAAEDPTYDGVVVVGGLNTLNPKFINQNVYATQSEMHYVKDSTSGFHDFLPALNQSRYFHSSTTLSDGSLLIIGGISVKVVDGWLGGGIGGIGLEDTVLKSVERLANPFQFEVKKTPTSWAADSELLQARFFGVMANLPSGEAIVMGGTWK